MKRKLKIVILIILLLLAIGIGITTYEHVLGNIATIVLFIVFMIILLIPSKEDREEEEIKKAKENIDAQLIKEREDRKIRQQEIIENTKNMTETTRLIMDGYPDFKLSNIYIFSKRYKAEFGPFDDGNRIFPAIDPLFEELLHKEGGQISKKTIRGFKITSPSSGLFGPMNYFGSFKKEPVEISLSADEIMEHFMAIPSWQKFGKGFWYVLNTKPNENPVLENFRFVSIFIPEKHKQYVLYCYEYKKWSPFCDQCGEESRFFVSIDNALKFQ
ncbi:MAG: hypothetical protein WC662_04080 [Candidatus Paceibacterota bacterium]|jgi:hypothetical protein